MVSIGFIFGLFALFLWILSWVYILLAVALGTPADVATTWLQKCDTWFLYAAGVCVVVAAIEVVWFLVSRSR